MRKEFVPYQIALDMKSIGFDEPFKPFNTFYYRNGNLCEANEDAVIYFNSEFILAPLKQQAFRWFREKHGLYPDIFVDDNNLFGFMISYFVEEGRADTAITRHFETYEEAEQACLDKLIEICKNQKQ